VGGEKGTTNFLPGGVALKNEHRPHGKGGSNGGGVRGGDLPKGCGFGMTSWDQTSERGVSKGWEVGVSWGGTQRIGGATHLYGKKLGLK